MHFWYVTILKYSTFLQTMFDSSWIKFLELPSRLQNKWVNEKQAKWLQEETIG